MTSTQSQNLSLVIERTYNAPPERVFRAWTDPSKLRHWFAPNDELETEAVVDLQVGGGYHFNLGQHTVAGVYKVVSPPERLVFTWQWQHEQADDPMLVTLDFHPHSSGTRLVLKHERLASQEEYDNHRWGWEQNLGRLERLLDAEA